VNTVPDAIPISRRSFLCACSMLALGLEGCARLLENTRSSSLAIAKPPAHAYVPVLEALVRTVLPFDHPRFPDVAPEQIMQRLITLFPLHADDEDALAIRRALMIFDDVRLFPAAPPALLGQEREALDIGNRHSGAWSAAAANLRAADERLYAEFSRGLQTTLPAHFVDLTPDSRGRYYQLWSQSGFSVKRHFYRASKTLVLVTAWSMDGIWQAIGYAGPLVTGHDQA
jgi:hypothetical protein